MNEFLLYFKMNWAKKETVWFAVLNVLLTAKGSFYSLSLCNNIFTHSLVHASKIFIKINVENERSMEAQEKAG